MNTEEYWTGIADVNSSELPNAARGAVYRVVTYAKDYDLFVQKVTDVLSSSGDILTMIEEPERLSTFLEHGWVEKDHEIYEMMRTAEKNKQDVVCGEVEYYTLDDA